MKASPLVWARLPQFLGEFRCYSYRKYGVVALRAKKSEARLLALRPNMPIAAVCRIDGIDRREWVKQGTAVIYLDILELYDCDML